MTTELIDRIDVLARAWDAQAPTITLDEIVGRTTPSLLDPHEGPLVEVLTAPAHRPRTLVWAMSSVAVASIVLGVLVYAGRNERDLDDPSLEPTPATSVGSTAPAPTAAATTTAPATTTTVAATTLPPPDVTTRLAEIDAARTVALRGATTFGFTVRHLSTRPDGAVESDTSAQVVLRNDGSVAVVSDTIVWSFYDASSGTARLAYIGADGQTAYQELNGQADNSVALGVPTGLPNGIVEPFPLFADGVVGIADEVVGGRATWRIDREYPSVAGSPEQTTSTWIDQQAGVTLQSRSTGMHSSNGIALTDTVTLSGLDTGAALSADFPGSFPDGATVDRSGDPSQFGPTTIEEAASLFDASIVAPTMPADLVALSTMNFGNDDGTTTASPSLIVRWFDGFLRTEYRVTSFPPSMAMPDTCAAPCTGSLLDEIRSWGGEGTAVDVRRGGLGISISGPSRQAIQAVIDSLVELP